MIYKVPFNDGYPPQWTCPICNKGILKEKVDSFVRKETKGSLDSHIHEDWDSDWIVYTYSCQFICTNPSCEETVFNMGSGSVDYEVEFDHSNGFEKQVYYEQFKPKFFLPHLNIFKISKNTPVCIRSPIEESFKLFFASPASSANHLRIALEKLLDYLKIKKLRLQDSKRITISTHGRINLLPQKFCKFKELFFAIKWLGNNGSHAQDVSMDDVMDAYDIFEIILDELFDNKTREISKLAKKIIKVKGRKSKKIHL